MSKRERITQADVCVERVTLAQASYDAAVDRIGMQALALVSVLSPKQVAVTDDAGSIPAEGAH
jgi:hypothetical protein